MGGARARFVVVLLAGLALLGLVAFVGVEGTMRATRDVAGVSH